MKPLVSVIVPVHNAEASIASCLGAIRSSDYGPLDVIVVDDSSDDRSVEIIREFPCRLVRLSRRSGAARARNAGLFEARGEILFFTDADCIVYEDTIGRAVEVYESHGPDTVLGGTYAGRAFDPGLFSDFQAMYVNYHESRNASVPDYVATHAMMVNARTFRESGGFREDFMPILEDVEFSHRMKGRGFPLYIDPEIRVRHQFDFSLWGSLKNAFRKSYYWTAYSASHGDVLADSGTASHGLKVNVCAWCLALVVSAAAVLFDAPLFVAGVVTAQFINLIAQRHFLSHLLSSANRATGLLSMLYYLVVYPAPVAAGAAAGLLKYLAASLRSGRVGQGLFHRCRDLEGDLKPPA